MLTIPGNFTSITVSTIQCDITQLTVQYFVTARERDPFCEGDQQKGRPRILLALARSENHLPPVLATWVIRPEL
jgi:hypothetical protein